MPGNEAALPTLASSISATPSPEQITARTSHGFEVRWYEYLGACVIVAAGEYDMGSITPLQKTLRTAAERYPKVILETSGVTFADSSFLDLLLLAHQMGTLRLVAPSAPVRRLCEITGVDSVLAIRQTVEDATAT
ncbi:STAS domain-containing protein [Streptomyces alfalfae]|uniref:STAS domain-containing protein n=1 Tax=Streptomyces alfalfae TaxID=1642299 RepID=A0A7T4PCV0_9ACTN|nr:STAS domain-containing protein [Streptomyces alfalfae]QQC87908.1 STAS domain-containing protein [Streptomyces alfalfae]